MNRELKYIKDNDFKIGDIVNWEFISGREFTIIEISQVVSPNGIVFYNIRLQNPEFSATHYRSFIVNPLEIKHTKSYMRDKKINSLLK